MNSIMNSEADSVFAFSILKSILKQSRNQVLFIWVHYHDSQDDKDSDSNSKVKYYNYYINFSSYHTSISINMWQHLKQHHQINIKVAVNQIQQEVL